MAAAYMTLLGALFVFGVLYLVVAGSKAIRDDDELQDQALRSLK
ncbi:hypothetical protein [Paenibacillus sp. NPDC058174]